MRTIVLHVFEKCMLLTSSFRLPAHVECGVCVHAVVFVPHAFSFSRGPRGCPLCHKACSACNVLESGGIPIILPSLSDLVRHGSQVTVEQSVVAVRRRPTDRRAHIAVTGEAGVDFVTERTGAKETFSIRSGCEDGGTGWPRLVCRVVCER